MQQMNYRETAQRDGYTIILVNKSDEVLYLSPAVSPFLQYSGGMPKPDLFSMLPAELHAPAKLVLAHARETGEATRAETAALRLSGRELTLRLSAESLRGSDLPVGAMLLRLDKADVAGMQDELPRIPEKDIVISQLYDGLAQERERVQALQLQYEEAYRNLAVSNEEMYSINEELRLAADSLEKSRAEAERSNLELQKSHDEIDNFIAATELAMIVVDRNLYIKRFTPAAARLLSLMTDDYEKRLAQASVLLHSQHIEENARRVITEKRKTEFEIPLRTGTWYILRITPYRTSAHSIEGAVLTFIDISARKESEGKLRLAEQRWKLALEASGDGVWDWNIRSGKATMTPGWKKILYYRPEDSVAENLAAWTEMIHPEDRNAVLADLRAASEGGSFSAEYRIRCRDGRWKWVLSRGAVVERELNGKPLRMAGTLSDISAKKTSEQEIWRRANFDNLTGLPNRSYFLERLDVEVRHAQREGASFALLFIDLDRFKEVNDLHGHETGDALLKAAAERIRSCIRESDIAARLGGDEFTLILTGAHDLAAIELIAEKLLEKLALPFRLGKHVAHISGSVGVTLYPRDATAPGDLIRNADQAMYAAKADGRNRCRFFDQAMQDAALHRIRIISDLHKAVPRQLRLFFQPIVDLKSGRIVKAEALLRWQHPDRGLMLPGEFVPLAEETGLIGRVGEWVLEEAAHWALRWSTLRGGSFQVSINKSPLEFSGRGERAQPDMSAHLQRIGLDSDNLSVEITEGVLLDATPQVRESMSRLREAGIQLSIDDFGTGYSSMSYLTQYRADFLKIDKSFVSERAGNHACGAIAETIIVMAHKLGLQVIAEGIERQDQHDWLAGAGCDYGQGYLYSPPIEPESFEQLISAEPVAVGAAAGL